MKRLKQTLLIGVLSLGAGCEKAPIQAQKSLYDPTVDSLLDTLSKRKPQNADSAKAWPRNIDSSAADSTALLQASDSLCDSTAMDDSLAHADSAQCAVPQIDELELGTEVIDSIEEQGVDAMDSVVCRTRRWQQAVNDTTAKTQTLRK